MLYIYIQSFTLLFYKTIPNPMKKFFYIILLLTLFFLPHFVFSQSKPKLVVGIVIDQMRYDYLYRYYDKYAEGGFKKLMNQGFVCQNAHYNYVPTETGPGHASIYTGTTPAYHGIVANDWYEKGRNIYCVLDSTEKAVGSLSGKGDISPRNILTTTIGDQLKIVSNNQCKVIGISLKDRGAVLPAGHAANAAYWFDYVSGKFITSTYYMQTLPQWAEDFNGKKLPDEFLNQTWQTLLPIEQYTESQKDDNKYEKIAFGKDKPVFPYNLKEISKALESSQLKTSKYEILSQTPYGNSLVKEMAVAALKAEKLGKGNFTDLLAISFSSTDIAGHAFGPQSIEIQDIYLRLDRDIENLLKELDKEVGQGNYTLFLTADHAAAQVPRYAQDLKLPGGYTDLKPCKEGLEKHLQKLYGQGNWVTYFEFNGVYLNRNLIQSKNISLEDAQRKTAEYLKTCEAVFNTFPAVDLERENYTKGMASLVQNGYFHRRSPDVYVIHQSGWFDTGWTKGGTTHGSAYNYDTHVPILFYGWNVPKGGTIERVEIIDIAPTISSLLKLQFPSGCSGEPIEDVFEK
jgi:predicted AlkP superfamily pyrophosphatase or phosphodiesterase